MRKLLLLIGMISSLAVLAQEQATELNSVDRMLGQKDQKLVIGGYGHIDYNQPIGKDEQKNGNLDVHRLVLLFAYHFSDKLQLVTEIELEHVKDVFVEQAFINYKFNNAFQLRGGLMLVPMGVVNELHEPTVYFGVERPLLDKIVVPTTWREIGVGAHGNIHQLSLKYQVYAFNGFLGYDDQAKFRGADGFRKGRQKGAESVFTSPNLSAKIDYYGIPRLKLGLATYLGKSQSNLFDGLPKDDKLLQQQADSSVINIAMFGLDATYRIEGIQFRGQLIWVNNGNVQEYNQFGGADLGEQMMGYYFEAAYNVFKTTSFKTELLPFIRYEYINNHQQTIGFEPNKDYETQLITGGVNWKIHSGVVLKADYQWIKTAAQSDFSHAFNAGVGFVF